ncbi:MAG: AMP-binding protein, partial [Caulobacteraceae bacterium]
HELIEAEGVTFTSGVQTIWTGYLAWLEARGLSPTTLKTVMIGGSAVPLAMAEAFRARHGIDVLQIWGMTETCPLGVVASPTPALAAHGEAEMQQALWTRSGRLQFGIEIKIVGEDGKDAPWDGETSGALMCRGPWTVRRYFRQDEDVVDAEGWFDTGDIASIDRDGFLRITDRAKDVIKSGGEWISSIDLENIACGCEGVRTAAVIGVPHPKWEERPVMIIEAAEAGAVSPEKVLAYLAPRIAKWWMPDEIVLAPIPLTATGKIDKKKLREAWRERSLAPA